MKFKHTHTTVVVVLVVLAAWSISYGQKPPTSIDKERGHVILDTLKDDLKRYYYDPGFHGMDLNTRFKTADEKIKQAQSLGQIFGTIAQVLVDLDDSHTFFLPPGRSYRTEYGWQMQVIGDKCYVTAVKPGSDAAAKGLHQGDEIYAIDGIGPTRENFWKIQYMYRALRPQPGVRLQVIKPDGRQQQLDVLARIDQVKRVLNLSGDDDGTDIWNMVRESENESRLHRQRYVDLSDDVFVWKMPEFDLLKDDVDQFVSKFRKKKGVVIDLRGNSGGYVETLVRLLGNVLDHDLKVGDLKRRKDSKPLLAKTRGSEIFTGKLLVLIDSQSASASELFARVVQLEKRGTVIGDRSAGAVMEAKQYPHQLGIDTVVPYGVSITEADIIMGDGKSLEHTGVTPDEIKIPTAMDLATQKDPVLAYAASLLGVTITPEKAGALFPIEWRK